MIRIPASLLPIILLTEGSIYFDSYGQHYENKLEILLYFFHHIRPKNGVELSTCHGVFSYAHLHHSGIGVENHPQAHNRRMDKFCRHQWKKRQRQP